MLHLPPRTRIPQGPGKASCACVHPPHGSGGEFDLDFVISIQYFALSTIRQTCLYTAFSHITEKENKRAFNAAGWINFNFHGYEHRYEPYPSWLVCGSEKKTWLSNKAASGMHAAHATSCNVPASSRSLGTFHKVDF